MKASRVPSGPSGADPTAATQSTRLHNSGWGRPPDVYRTPGIGQAFTVSLHRLCDAYESQALPATLLARCLQHLGAAEPAMSGAAPRDALRALRARVQARGWLHGIVLSSNILALGPQAAQARASQAQPAASVPLDTIALALVLCSAASPPLVLWDAPISDHLIRRPGKLVLRWLRRDLASPEAKAQWETLATLGAQHD